MIRYTQFKDITENPQLFLFHAGGDETYLCTKEEKRLLEAGVPANVVTELLSAWDNDVLEFCYLLDRHKLSNQRIWDTLPRIDDDWQVEANSQNLLRAYLLEGLDVLYRNPEHPYPTIEIVRSGFGFQFAIGHENCTIFTPASYDDNDLVLMGMLAMLRVVGAYYEDGIRVKNRRLVEYSAGYKKG